MLRVGIADEDTNAASFTHIPHVDLRNHVSVISVPCQSIQEYEDKVAEHQGWEHGQLFPEVETRPAWRITILRPSSDSEEVRSQLRGQEDAFFAFHHALMDGTSGRRFHEMLLAAPVFHGKEQVPSEPTYTLSFPEPPASIPERQEDVIKFTLSMRYMARTLWNEFGPSFLKASKPPVWNAVPISFALPNTTRVKTVDIAPDVLAGLLSACRSHGVTITALMHALVLASLSARIPSPATAPAFSSSTPISLRPYTSPALMNPAHVASLRCLVASYNHHFSREAVAALRAPSADTNALIWQAAQDFKAGLAARLASLPGDDIMGMLKFIGDWFDFWRGKDGKPRVDSWEISNIGVLKNPDDDGNTEAPRATRMLFTNSAMVVGPPMGVNVASVAGSKLTIGLSWQEAVVEDELMGQLAEDLAAYAAKYHETGSSFV